MSKVLFDSMAWLNENPADHIDEYLDCTGQTKDDFKNRHGVYDPELLLSYVREWLSDNSEWDWRDFLEQCREEEPHHCLVTGYFMSWMGPQAGGKIYKDLESAVSGSILDGDSHPIFSINDEGMLVLDETHHDAPCNGNHYEFRILTKRGEQYYENHKDDDRRTLHEALKEKGRSRNVNIKIFAL